MRTNKTDKMKRVGGPIIQNARDRWQSNNTPSLNKILMFGKLLTGTIVSNWKTNRFSVDMMKHHQQSKPAAGIRDWLSLDTGMIVVVFICIMYLVLVFGLLFYVKNDWCDLLFKNMTVSAGFNDFIKNQLEQFIVNQLEWVWHSPFTEAECWPCGLKNCSKSVLQSLYLTQSAVFNGTTYNNSTQPIADDNKFPDWSNKYDAV